MALVYKEDLEIETSCDGQAADLEIAGLCACTDSYGITKSADQVLSPPIHEIIGSNKIQMVILVVEISAPAKAKTHIGNRS